MTRLLLYAVGLALVVGACSGNTDSPSPPDTESTDAPAETVTTTTAEAASTTAIELDVETVSTGETTTTAAPVDEWEIGGILEATGPIEGTFDLAPLCDTRVDDEGGYLHVAFGYPMNEDPAEPVVIVVIPVHGWEGEGRLTAPLEATYQAGGSIEDLVLEEAAGQASLLVAFLEAVGGAEVVQMEFTGSFQGAVSGTIEGALTCLAG